jgi:hypothetical protein
MDYLTTNILKKLPYESRMPMTDLDDFELLERDGFGDIWYTKVWRNLDRDGFWNDWDTEIS